MVVDPAIAAGKKAAVVAGLNAVASAEAAARQAIAEAEAAGVTVEHGLGETEAAAARTAAKFFTLVELA
ncbi:MAG TPA: hypothetical protein VGV37_02450 [Aliidongia sp.]|uniref:hypothetical protein n=1 Tax=Aliidongia sp. TaxID=1914230 RepID=UPI002DDD7976|nr:hypothetical protein [Aliidongia sp.]HEV2673371.1 hypothetical protein [Aliidongia sp.]